MQSHESVLARFGQRLRELRLRKNLSQEALAELAQLDRTYISGIERGKRNPSLRNLISITNALEISLASLFEDIG
jgi:transcriptional regulator with XRE-family HTH domain